jgi:hypothetical protein
MNAFFPRTPQGGAAEAEHPRLQQRPPTDAERRARWEVRAAQWRARELAEAVFGHVRESALFGSRASGPIRGLLRLRVPFRDVHVHQEREARFMAAVAADPVLACVRLVYVLGPDTD